METMTKAPPDRQPGKRRKTAAAPAGNGAAAPILDRAGILAAEDLPVEPVEVPRWHGRVLVRSLNGAQRIHYEQRCAALRAEAPDDPDSNMNVLLLLVVATAVDEAGAALFTEDDLPALKAKNFDACKLVVEKALVLNGMRDEDIEELAGN